MTLMTVAEMPGTPDASRRALPYLEADDVGSYEHPDALNQVPQGMDKRCSHSQAAVPVAAALGCVWRVQLRYMRVSVGMGVGVKVARLIQQKPHSESERREMLQGTGFRVCWGGFLGFFFLLNQIIGKVIFSVISCLIYEN